MKVVIGSDHAGFGLKKFLVRMLKRQGHDLRDVGAYNTKPSDYPDFAEKVAMSLRQGAARRGILICGSGVGACVAANKIPGIRAGICHDTYSAHQGVEHDDMNVLVLGSRVIGEELAGELAQAFLKAEFIKEKKYVRRLLKMQAIEVRYGNTRPKNQSFKRIKK